MEHIYTYTHTHIYTTHTHTHTALGVIGLISHLIAFGVLFFYNFTYLFLAVLGLSCFAQAFINMEDFHVLSHKILK